MTLFCRPGTPATWGLGFCQDLITLRLRSRQDLITLRLRFRQDLITLRLLFFGGGERVTSFLLRWTSIFYARPLSTVGNTRAVLVGVLSF